MPKTDKNPDYSFDHCVQRVKERYGQDLTLKQYNEWNKSLQLWVKTNGDAIKFTKGKQTVEYNGIITLSNIMPLSKIKINDKNISYTFKYVDSDSIYYLVFETERNCITTFLPPKSFN